jgi:hypothetical protein
MDRNLTKTLNSFRLGAPGKDRKYMAEFHNRLYSGILAAVKHNRETDYCLDNHEKCCSYYCKVKHENRVPNTSASYLLKAKVVKLQLTLDKLKKKEADCISG